MNAVMAGVAVASNQSAGDAVHSVGVVVLFTMVPIAALMLRQARGGKCENADASMRSRVGDMLLFALPVLMWSRLTLQRHTGLEVGVGTLIGAGAGVAIHCL